MPPLRTGAAAPDSSLRIGLVLSGGGTRGIAHIGVLRALLEAGIEPTHVAGASCGALVGGLFAAGLEPDAILEVFRTTDPLQLRHVAIGKPGLIDAQKYLPAFARHFPRDSFGALRRRLSVVATDLFSGEPRVFESGPVVRAIVASCCLPMIYAPMEIGGRWYADGGIVDNFPVGLVRERCEFVIAVHVSPLPKIGRRDLGSGLAVLERAFEIGMYRQSLACFDRCDALILPRAVARFGMFETRRLAAIEAAGYAEAVAALPALRRALAAARRGSAIQRKANGAWFPPPRTTRGSAPSQRSSTVA